MTGSCEQVHGIEPFLQRCAAAFKWRSDHRVNVMAAPCALIGKLFGDASKAAMLVALRAIQFKTITNLHQMFQAGVIVWEAFEEIGNCELFGHHLSLLTD